MERREGSRVLVATSSSNTRVLVAIGSRVLVAIGSRIGSSLVAIGSNCIGSNC